MAPSNPNARTLALANQLKPPSVVWVLVGAMSSLALLLARRILEEDPNARIARLVDAGQELGPDTFELEQIAGDPNRILTITCDVLKEASVQAGFD